MVYYVLSHLVWRRHNDDMIYFEFPYLHYNTTLLKKKKRESIHGSNDLEVHVSNFKNEKKRNKIAERLYENKKFIHFVN